jgi:hypothetical protein
MELYSTSPYAFIEWTENFPFFYRAPTGDIDNCTFFISLHTFVTKITQNKVMTKCSTLQLALRRCMPRVTLISYVRQWPGTTALYEPWPFGGETAPVFLNFRHNTAVRVSCPANAILFLQKSPILGISVNDRLKMKRWRTPLSHYAD